MSNDYLFRYNAKLNRVIDGDTMEMIVDHGFRIYSLKTIRLARCNTPETKGREKVAGTFVADFVRQLLDDSKTIVIQSRKIQKTFDRYVFEVVFDGNNLTDELLFRRLAWETNEFGKLIEKRDLKTLDLPRKVANEFDG